MVVYKCYKCGEEIEENLLNKQNIVCPKCNCRIFIKKRLHVVKVDAI